MKSVGEVVKDFVEASRLSYRRFAEALTQSLKNEELSHSAISTWISGRSEPSTDFLLQTLVAYGDWRRDFALECLRAKIPEVFVDGADQLSEIVSSKLRGQVKLEDDVWDALIEWAKEQKGKGADEERLSSE